MLVLKGSTSTSRSVQPTEKQAVSTMAASTPYLSFLSWASTRSGMRTWRTPSALAALLTSSCSAPKGHSQPQNVPRPQTTALRMTAPQSTTVIGSYMKKLRLRPASSAWTSAVMLTTDSWPCAYQPMKPSVNSR